MHFSTFRFERTLSIRPLAAVSDFVVGELPAMLATTSCDDLRSRLLQIDAVITPDFRAACRGLPVESARIACLDLALLAQACEHRQIALPARLHLLFIDMTSRQARIPVMLYEDCVLNNPIDTDPRLFTCDEAGECERTFLDLHKRIEKALENILHHLAMLADEDRRAAAIVECDESGKDLVDYFKAFHAMPMELFLKFRNYYASPPNGRHLGVSGRFSESINTLRLRLEGPRIRWAIPDYFNELLENLQYYPSTGRARLLDAIEQAVMREDACIDPLARRHADVRDLAVRLRKSMDSMTGIHLHLVKKYVS
jgi:hypothetical protein